MPPWNLQRVRPGTGYCRQVPPALVFAPQRFDSLWGVCSPMGCGGSGWPGDGPGWPFPSLETPLLGVSSAIALESIPGPLERACCGVQGFRGRRCVVRVGRMVYGCFHAGMMPLCSSPVRVETPSGTPGHEHQHNGQDKAQDQPVPEPFQHVQQPLHDCAPFSATCRYSTSTVICWP
jgi:hypothetical protein